MFSTELSYSSRADKPEYVYDKYRSILTDSVLDVGADQGLLGDQLPAPIDYYPIGIGPGVDVRVDLERGDLPFNDDEFNCVVCLEVLEHLDNLHTVFDELCRVAERFVIVSLPNPWASFMGMLKRGYYGDEKRPIKYYYLPTDAPRDRHKWFFGAHEAVTFIEERAAQNGCRAIQIDQEWSIDSPILRGLMKVALRIAIDREVDVDSLMRANTWGVIETSDG